MNINDNEEIKISCDITAAQLHLAGLLTLSAEVDKTDVETVSKVLRNAIWGSENELAEIPIDITIAGNRARDRQLHLNYSPTEADNETFLSLTVEYPEPYRHVPATLNFSRQQLISLWHRAKDAILHEQDRLAEASSEPAAAYAIIREYKTMSLICSVLEFVAGGNPDVAPVSAFEDWVETTGCKGAVGIAQRMKMTA